MADASAGVGVGAPRNETVSLLRLEPSLQQGHLLFIPIVTQSDTELGGVVA
jgi:hypothetical protein